MIADCGVLLASYVKRTDGEDVATSTQRAKRAPSKKVAGTQRRDAQVVVSLEPPLETVPIYSNHIEVGHTKHEFTIFAGRVPAKMPAERFRLASESGVLQMEPDVSILIAPTLMPGLIRALQIQLAAWEEKHGPVPKKEGEE